MIEVEAQKQGTANPEKKETKRLVHATRRNGPHQQVTYSWRTSSLLPQFLTSITRVGFKFVARSLSHGPSLVLPKMDTTLAKMQNT